MLVLHQIYIICCTYLSMLLNIDIYYTCEWRFCVLSIFNFNFEVSLDIHILGRTLGNKRHISFKKARIELKQYCSLYKSAICVKFLYFHFKILCFLYKLNRNRYKHKIFGKIVCKYKVYSKNTF